MWCLNRSCLSLVFIFLINKGLSQNKPPDTASFKTVVAGPEYKKSNFYQKLWGRNRRLEWTTAVQVPVLWLDKIDGGLTASESNGGNETKGLRLKSANGKEYALRSINKSRDEVVPKEFKHTFIENIIRDGVSMSHPYGAFALPVMAQHAGIYHTEPKLVYLPQQPALDSMNEKFGNDLYMFEQRLSGDWSDADNLGNFKAFLSTEEVVNKLKEDNHNKADQYAFATVRLFDMLIADWDRHEDQWKWGEKKGEDGSVYILIPKDRDQAFFTHNGLLINKALAAIGNGYMQSIDYDSKNISALNLEERYMDPFFTDAMSQEDWVKAAKDLQHSLTDLVIEQSIQQLPPEIFAESGKELIAKLKSRRDQLIKYASQYYLFLAKEVQITASKKKEYFEIKIDDGGKTSIKIYSINKEGERDESAFYSRIFMPAETKSIRVFGVGGEDIYSIDGDGNAIKLIIIGGPDKDSVIQNGSSRVDIYDDRENSFQTNHARLHLSSDSMIRGLVYSGKKTNPGDYAGINFVKKGIAPSFSYNNADRFFVGIGYRFTKHKWNSTHYLIKELIDLHYSISQKAFSVDYAAEFPELINKWDFFLELNYDAVRWTNFFGLGNETGLTDYNKNFFRMRTIEGLARAGINRQFGKSSISISGFFQSVKIIADTERFVAKVVLPDNQDAFETNKYAGAQFTYNFFDLNDSIVPTRGLTFSGNAVYFDNVNQKEFFQKYFGKLQCYIPFGNKISLAIRAGAATVLCKSGILNSAEFYEHVVLGGPANLRGFIRERFWGKSSFYNNNELRFITKIRTRLLNAKAGLLLFFDDGRVWVPGESSATLHTGYGAGILLAPFSKISATVTYGISKESRLLQVSVNKFLK